MKRVGIKTGTEDQNRKKKEKKQHKIKRNKNLYKLFLPAPRLVGQFFCVVFISS